MDNWRIIETAWEPEKQHHKETVFTIGNGYLSTRGTFEEGYPGQEASTLVHGVFDDVPLVFSELANTPNWLYFDLFVEGERFRMDRGQILAYERELDLRSAVLTRKIRLQSLAGKTLDLQIERFTSLADEHLMAIRYRVEAVDFSGRLEFRSGLPGHVDNAGWSHWEWVDQGRLDVNSAYLRLCTKVTRIELAEAFQLKVSGVEELDYEYWDSNLSPILVSRFNLQQGQAATAYKLVSVFTSRDVEDVKAAVQEKLKQAEEQGYANLRAANEAAWLKEWQRCDVSIQGDDEADLALRYNLFQLLIAAPRHDERVSIAAKTLSGFGYRGHAFWDTEIFILPFFIYTSPHIARNLLMYRYHTLPGARRKARGSGYEGAMYAWESAATGEETTPRWLPVTGSADLVRIWCGDIEHHISADVAFATFQYWQVTGDDEFMRDYGAEIILDTAVFWGSRVEWNEEKGVYEISNVIGPDEYHDHVDNNAYTNNLVRWNLAAALQVLDWLRKEYPARAIELENSLGLRPERLAHWKDVIDKLVLGFNPQTGLFEQFEGFFQLRDVDLGTFEPRKQSLQALLGIEGVQDYQILKQPDVLMMLYLLGSQFSREVIQANLAYYTPRTDLTYGSSLGPAIQAILAARNGDHEAAYRFFMLAAKTDLENLRGNTPDGIHAATAGGLWQAAVFGFAGLRLTEDGPLADPSLPLSWKNLQFRVQYRGKPYEFDLHPPPVTPETSQAYSAGPRFPILGAIFDLDGVLTDTSELHYRAWKRLADEEGIPFDRQANEALRGISRRESLLLMLKGRQLPEEKIQELMDCKNRYYQDLIASLGPDDLLPGARSLLEEIRQAGVKIAVASASKNAHDVIEKLGIADLLDAISDGYDAQRQKPAPDLFLHAARQLNLPPEQCVVFEDAEAGVAAALAGEMWAVGIGPLERVGAAHVVVPNLDEVTWDGLWDRLAAVDKQRFVSRQMGTVS